MDWEKLTDSIRELGYNKIITGKSNILVVVNSDISINFSAKGECSIVGKNAISTTVDNRLQIIWKQYLKALYYQNLFNQLGDTRKALKERVELNKYYKNLRKELGYIESTITRKNLDSSYWLGSKKSELDSSYYHSQKYTYDLIKKILKIKLEIKEKLNAKSLQCNTGSRSS